MLQRNGKKLTLMILINKRNSPINKKVLKPKALHTPFERKKICYATRPLQG